MDKIIDSSNDAQSTVFSRAAKGTLGLWAVFESLIMVCPCKQAYGKEPRVFVVVPGCRREYLPRPITSKADARLISADNAAGRYGSRTIEIGRIFGLPRDSDAR